MPRSLEDIINEVMSEEERKLYDSQTTENFRPALNNRDSIYNIPVPMTAPNLEASSIPTTYDLMYNPAQMDAPYPQRSPLDYIRPGTKMNDTKTFQQSERDEDEYRAASRGSVIDEIVPYEDSQAELPIPPDGMLPPKKRYSMPQYDMPQTPQMTPNTPDMEALMDFYTSGGTVGL